MARWEPNARGRLEQAALELFDERGYHQTTVQDIATRAGLTKRTYFRHFADKREVLFGGGESFRQLFLNSLDDAPASAAPLDAMAVTLEAVAATFADPDRRATAHRRQHVIAANAELQERELVKLASVAAALSERLRERGATEPAASVAAEAAIAVLRTAFDRWVAAPQEADLSEFVRESLAVLRLFGANG